ncbi:hypothetical protein M8818_007692 [Zalaria obscura]|uniref:Uncharacterized protein n=1 Tax=Zalaria obscura TaxID=2024903 RepID=A0ACC3S2V0_9PEZI
MDSTPTSLLDLLSNNIILGTTAPYLPVAGILALSATCKDLRSLILTTPDAFRHVDLSFKQSAIIDPSPIDSGGISWRAERMDEALTEDDFYAGPLRGIFSTLQKQHALVNIKTLILDGLTVPADVVREIIAEDRFNVKILSIREAKQLNERKLQQVLRYAVRPTRPEGTPKLRALYVFGPRDAPLRAAPEPKASGWSSLRAGVMSSEGAQIGAEWNQRSSAALSSSLAQPDDKWYRTSGRVLRQPTSDWPGTLQDCQGIIAFDAVLCRGPKHDVTKTRSEDYLKPAIATVALGPKGCECCGSCPEGAAIFGKSDDTCFPLLTPPPLHASTVRAAQFPTPLSTHSDGMSTIPPLILRCEDCLRGRWCERCNKWWCEACYEEPISRDHLRTEMQQLELREDLQRHGWDYIEGEKRGRPVKVYSKLCIESCLVSEMWPIVDGMWG